MPYRYNSQGQIEWVDSDTPQGGTALPTSQMTGQYVPPTPGSSPLGNRDYLNNLSGGSAWDLLRGPLPPGKKYNANGEVVNTTAFDKFDTGFGNAMKWGGIGLGVGAGGALLGGALAGAYGAGAGGAGLGGGAGAGGVGGAGSGLALTPEGVLLPAGAAAGGGGAAATGATTADLILGTGAAPATIGIPTTAAGALATTAGGGAAAGGTAALAAKAVPSILTTLATLYANRQTPAEKAQAAALDQQRQYLAYQMAKERSMDPVHDALIRMAMGMMPTYSQNLFTNYQGLPGVSAPNAAAHYSAPGIGGGGYGGGQ